MRNYYSMLIDINMTEIRLEALKEKKAIIESKMTSCTSGNSEPVSGTPSNDKIIRYIIELADIESEIELKEAELSALKRGLDKMEKIITQVKGKQDIQSRIFVMKFIENLPVREIAVRIPCDISTVYRQINKINKKLL